MYAKNFQFSEKNFRNEMESIRTPFRSKRLKKRKVIEQDSDINPGSPIMSAVILGCPNGMSNKQGITRLLEFWKLNNGLTDSIKPLLVLPQSQ